MSQAPDLKIQALTMQFGGLKAVADLDLEIPDGSVFGLIGPNGAGKTTVFNVLTGVYSPTQGNIHAFGQSIAGKKPYQITRIGIARTFQNIRLFRNLSVLQNILIAQDNDPSRKPPSVWSSIIRTKGAVHFDIEQESRAQELLDLFQLSSRTETLARNLAYGEQRRLEIARALATGARLLLLDEPAAGMNSQETASLVKTIETVRERFKCTVFLIEHDMSLVMRICERIAVLDYGTKIAEGTPKEIQANPKVIEAYLGKAAAHAEV